MPAKIIVLKGLPASGKSTWAKEEAKRKGVRRVCRDDIRRMLGPYDDFHDDRERIVTRIETEAVRGILAHDETAIVDATHLNPKYLIAWQNIADLYDAKVEVRDFPVGLREALKRNAGRDPSERVPNRVIHEMYRKWLAPKVEKVDGLPEAIIVDLDGTLCIHQGRSPYDTGKCETDRLNETLWDVVLSYARPSNGIATEIIFLSGRDDIFRPQTERWLAKNGIFQHVALHMRKTGDKRPDYIIKKEIYDTHIRTRFNVVVAFDDRDQVVDLWRSMGIPCFQVDEGWF